MLDVGFSELLVIGIVALIVVGPKELPKLFRTVSKTIATLRRMAGDFQHQFQEAMKEADLDDVRKSVEDLKSLNPANMIRETVENATKPLNDAARSLNDDFARATAMVTGGATGAAVGAMTVEGADLPTSPPPSPEAADAPATVGPLAAPAPEPAAEPVIELADLVPPQAPDLSAITPVHPATPGADAANRGPSA